MKKTIMMMALMICLAIRSYAQYDMIIFNSGDTIIGKINNDIVENSKEPNSTEDDRIHFTTKDGKNMIVLKSSIKSQQYIPYVNSDKVKYKNQTEQYCEILAYTWFGLDKIKILVDYGNSRWRDNREKSDDGNVLKFESVIDALNFMNSKKWIFVNAYIITTSNQNVYHYIMRRQVEN